MGKVHRYGDLRACGATTIVIGQSTVFVNNLLWAVEDDINTDGNGQLIPSGFTVRINNKPVIIDTDDAEPDDLCPILGGLHCAPSAVQGSGDVNCY